MEAIKRALSIAILCAIISAMSLLLGVIILWGIFIAIIKAMVRAIKILRWPT